MSFGLTAILLLRLDGRMGEWVHVVELAVHCACSSSVVIDELETLVADNLVRVERHRHTGLIERAMVNPRYGT